MSSCLNQQDKTSPIIALFDFDGTLTVQDTLLPFLKHTHHHYQYWQNLGRDSPKLLAYLLKRRSIHQVKEDLLTRFYHQWPVKKLEAAGRSYASEKLPQLFNQKALAKLYWHREQNHQVFIVSANLEIYLKPLISQLPIDGVIATKLEVINDLITGKVKGPVCYGQEKVSRIKSQLKTTINNCYIYAYGDSKGDRELLAFANSPHYRLFSNGRGLLIQ